jgi:hypothetical protein
MNTEKPLWTPNADAVQSSDLQKFMNLCGRGGDDYDAFWQWSVDEPALLGIRVTRSSRTPTK